MPIAVVEYGLTVAEHRAADRDLLALPHPQCPNCGSECWSKGRVYRKRAGAYVRQSRCIAAGCRTVITLLPSWLAVRAAATLDEIEHVVDSRETGKSWRTCADTAGLPHSPSKYRRWLRKFNAVMAAVLPSFPGLVLNHECGWIAQLRKLLGVAGIGALVALRWRLFSDNGSVLGPLDIFMHGRVRVQSLHSP